MLGPLQAAVLGHLVEERRVLELQHVDALDIRRHELVLHDHGPQLDQRHPARPRWRAPHLVREKRVEDRDAARARVDARAREVEL